MDIDKKLVGIRIKEERTKLGLTQEELALKLGLNSKGSLSQYESGSVLPSDEIKLKMCEIFSCSLDYLMGQSAIRNSIDVTKVHFANHGGLDTEGLTDRDIEELKAQIEFKRKYNKEKKRH